MTSESSYTLCRELAARLARRAPRIEEMIRALPGAASRRAVEPLSREFGLLETATRVAGIRGVQPLLGTVRRLLESWPAGEDVDRSGAADVVHQLWAALLDHLRVPETAVELPAALAQAHSLAAEFQEIPDFELSEPEFSPPAHATKRFADEGEMLLDELEQTLPRLTDRERHAAALDLTLRCTENMLSNTTLLLGSGGVLPPDSHPLEILQGALAELAAVLRWWQGSVDEIPSSLATDLGRMTDSLRALHRKVALPESRHVSPEEIQEALEAIRDINRDVSVPAAPETPVVETPMTGSPPASERTRETGQDSFIQVRLDRLDKLIRLSGELVVARNALGHVQTLLRQSRDSTAVMDALARSEKTFANTISELEDLVYGVRMRRVGELFQRFPRMVRDFAKERGKKIRLNVQGEDTELDNSVLQEVFDPLVHLVRNSCDHGLESPEDRAAAGKPETGTISLSAKVRGGDVVIEIGDDGRGIDPQLIRSRAVEKGLLTEAEASQLDDVGVRNLIFRPGFSTVEKVTDVSGRGVGMDVVQHNLSTVKGRATIESEVGAFTTIRLTLPMTMSVSRGLAVIVAEKRFIIPFEDVASMLDVDRKQIHAYGESLLIDLGERTVTIASLAGLLGNDDHVDLRRREQIAAVLLQVGPDQAAVVVDEILGIEDIAVRPLPGSMERIKIYGGCTILADGMVVPVLSTRELLEDSRISMAS